MNQDAPVIVVTESPAGKLEMVQTTRDIAEFYRAVFHRGNRDKCEIIPVDPVVVKEIG